MSIMLNINLYSGRGLFVLVLLILFALNTQAANLIFSNNNVEEIYHENHIVTKRVLSIFENAISGNVDDIVAIHTNRSILAEPDDFGNIQTYEGLEEIRALYEYYLNLLGNDFTVELTAGKRIQNLFMTTSIFYLQGECAFKASETFLFRLGRVFRQTAVLYPCDN